MNILNNLMRKKRAKHPFAIKNKTLKKENSSTKLSNLARRLQQKEEKVILKLFKMEPRKAKPKPARNITAFSRTNQRPRKKASTKRSRKRVATNRTPLLSRQSSTSNNCNASAILNMTVPDSLALGEVSPPRSKQMLAPDPLLMKLQNYGLPPKVKKSGATTFKGRGGSATPRHRSRFLLNLREGKV